MGVVVSGPATGAAATDPARRPVKSAASAIHLRGWVTSVMSDSSVAHGSVPGAGAGIYARRIHDARDSRVTFVPTGSVALHGLPTTKV